MCPLVKVKDVEKSSIMMVSAIRDEDSSNPASSNENMRR
jgi:hypothetical protein